MKNILCFIGSMRGGGAQRQMYELIKVLVGQDHRVTLLTFSQENQFALPTEVEWVVASPRSRVGKLVWLYRYLRKRHDDVLVSFMQYFSVQILPFYLLRRKRNRPLLICGERNITLKQDWFEPLLFRMYQKVDYIVPNTYTQAEYIVRIRPNLADKVRVVYNFTNPSLFCPSPQKYTTIGQEEKERKVEILITARYHPQKNPSKLLEVVRKLKEGGYERKVHFSWHGDLDSKADYVQELVADMNAKIHEWGVAEMVSLKNYADNPLPLYQNADAFCLPSLHEGVSNSMVEAMLCGLPCIVSRVSDNARIITDGEDGFLFDPLDVESFCQALQKFIGLSTDQICEMGQNARATAIEKFSYRQFAEGYLQLID